MSGNDSKLCINFPNLTVSVPTYYATRVLAENVTWISNSTGISVVCCRFTAKL